jgi:hypothetical protein
MKTIVTMACVGLLAVVLFTGCATVQSPVHGFIWTGVSAPVAATSNEASSRSGSASASSLLGWFAWGDASIEAASQKGGITKIHHVDHHSTSFLGIWANYRVTVYGE